MTKPIKKKRSVFRIEVTPQTVAQVERITSELGITQIAITSNLMQWFAKQPKLVQLAIVGAFPDDIQADVGTLVMQEMQRQPRDVSHKGGDPK